MTLTDQTCACEDLAREGLTLEPCCTSCHDDADEGYAQLIDHKLKDGREVRVCCAVYHELARRNLADE